MPLLEVKNLQVRVDEREILHGLSLAVNKGEVHAIMGPNGSGKSTLSHVIAGKPGYEVTEGEILFEGDDLLAMSPDERAAKGVFLAFQYPVEIPGVATMTFLRTALNAQRKARGESEFSTPDFLKKVREVAARLNIPQDMLRRGVNVGFSGGEKKRNEILQMALFEPAVCILDDVDSGLDIDALRVAADGVNALRSPDRAMVVITPYQRRVNYVVAHSVHAMAQRRGVAHGRSHLAAAVKLQAFKGAGRLVLVDGVFVPKLSDLDGLEKGVAVGSLRGVLESGEAALQAQLLTLDNDNPMVALNSAMMTDGVVIQIANGVVLTQPLQIIHVATATTPAAMFTRSLLRLGKDAGVTMVESYIAADGAKT